MNINSKINFKDTENCTVEKVEQYSLFEKSLSIADLIFFRNDSCTTEILLDLFMKKKKMGAISCLVVCRIISHWLTKTQLPHTEKCSSRYTFIISAYRIIALNGLQNSCFVMNAW